MRIRHPSRGEEAQEAKRGAPGGGGTQNVYSFMLVPQARFLNPKRTRMNVGEHDSTIIQGVRYSRLDSNCNPGVYTHTHARKLICSRTDGRFRVQLAAGRLW